MVMRSHSHSHQYMLKPLQIKTLIANRAHSESNNGKQKLLKKLIDVPLELQIKEVHLSQ
jgi:hypothetical protein